MRFRDHIKEVRGLRYLADKLEILSPVGRRVLLDMPMLYDVESIGDRLEVITRVVTSLGGSSGVKVVGEVALRLMQLRDIEGSVTLLRSGGILSDIDLFEIKHLALLTSTVSDIVKQSDLGLPMLPDVEKVIEVLDPEKKRIPTFHIYDQYSIELTEARRLYRDMPQGDAREAAWLHCAAIEDRVRRRLSRMLEPMGSALQEALDTLGYYDLVLAQAKLAKLDGYIRPHTISEGVTSYVGLWHPEVEAAVKSRGRQYQRVDISIPAGTTLITGANMAGKTVLLRALAVAQLLMQYGFFVPAAEAVICPVDDVRLCIGDAQNETEGLSSYGAEMMRLSDICQTVADGRRVLALIDEPARTTNPAEGQAIVSGLIDLLNTYPQTTALITTHYGSVHVPCRRLKVHGFVEGRVRMPLRVNDLSRCIDYGLEEVQDNDVPREAIRIAEILGVYPDLIERSCKYIQE